MVASGRLSIMIAEAAQSKRRSSRQFGISFEVPVGLSG
jgi:hypothetical protein